MNSIFPISLYDRTINDVDTELDTLLNNFFGRPRARGASRIDSHGISTMPHANVVKNSEGYSIDLAVPGMSREDFNISVENNTLTISSAVESHETSSDDTRHTREFSYMKFDRSWTLPKGVNSTAINARYDAGILSVMVPVSTEESQKLVIDVA